MIAAFTHFGNQMYSNYFVP